MSNEKLIKLSGGTLVDPTNQVNAKQADLYIKDGRIIPQPAKNEPLSQEYDVSGCIIMAGGIDPHTHIGGGKVTIARMLLPENQETAQDSDHGHAALSTLMTGYRYAEMGYTCCFEPAMLPINARQTHLEMADIPIVDKGGYVLLGNDDYLLRMLAAKKDQRQINDYVAWTVIASQALAVKVVNPGGISAFKFNQRQLDLDEKHSYYGLSPRAILQCLTRAVYELDLPHPLHVHGCNLGVPGNIDTTLNTIAGVEGLPMHLTHIQFHSYGTEGDRRFSSGAAQIAEAINGNPNISLDVGQIMFGQTVTESADNMQQYAQSPYAKPKRAVIMDIECDAGCGVVPFHYKEQSFVNALQWAIGLEIFLLVNDPWRVFLSTDHPNGAPFTSYPHLIRLLMDRSFRNDMLASIHPEAQKLSTLASIDREYSLYEIAIITRAAPAKSLGLIDRGHLAPGAAADIAVYKMHANKEKMFAKPQYVFKDGHLVVRNGKIVQLTDGTTHTIRPDYDPKIEKSLTTYFNRYHTMKLGNFKISNDEIIDAGKGSLEVHACRRIA